MIDGQQRITVLLLIIQYLKAKFSDKIYEIKNYSPCNLCINSFPAFSDLMDKNFILGELTEEQKLTDKYKQAERYTKLWRFLESNDILNDVHNIRDFFINLKKCEFNVLLSENNNENYNIDYFIDVNLKGVKLDTEDIFKGYLFYMNNSDKTLELWIKIKQSASEYNYNASNILKNKDEIYPLIKMLYHYFSCDLFLNKEYDKICFGSDFYLKKNFTFNNKTYYKDEHLIKVINNDSYICSSLEFLNKMVNLFSLIIRDGINDEFLSFFEQDRNNKDYVDRDVVIILKELMRLLLLDKDITVPHALIMKFFLEIIKQNKKIDKKKRKKFYSIYAFSVLFSFFATKKEISEIENVIHSENWFDEINKKVNEYLTNGRIIERKVVIQCKYILDDPDNISAHKCKSLAILYNFFKYQDGYLQLRKKTCKEIKSFLTNKEIFSVEHFIVNDSLNCVDMRTNDKYEYPKEIKKYSNSIFNYIFIPENLNNKVLKNFYIRDKIELLSENIDKIKCEYSKKVLEIVGKKFSSLPLVHNKNLIDVEASNAYYSYQFKKEFIDFSNEIIEKIISLFNVK